MGSYVNQKWGYSTYKYLELLFWAISVSLYLMNSKNLAFDILYICL